jgi:phosphonatase-like hydrolase
MPGAEACFAALRLRGLRITLDTAFTRDIAQTIVERFGWLRDGHIDDLVASDEVAAGRPGPDMIRALMARQDLADPAAVIKIGDTPVDIEEGRNARAGLVVAVTTGDFQRAALRACGPDYIIDKLAQLAPLLDLPRQ